MTAPMVLWFITPEGALMWRAWRCGYFGEGRTPSEAMAALYLAAPGLADP